MRDTDEGDNRWKRTQREDSELAPVVRWLEAGEEHPSREELVDKSPVTKHLVGQAGIVSLRVGEALGDDRRGNSRVAGGYATRITG